MLRVIEYFAKSLKVNGNGTTRRQHTSSYWHSVVTMALCCITSKIRQNLVENRDYFHTPLAFDAPITLRTCLLVLTQYMNMTDTQTYGQTDRQTL